MGSHVRLIVPNGIEKGRVLQVVDMEMVGLKKHWEQPELIVVVRSRPAETILASCKDRESGTGPEFNNAACLKIPGNNEGKCNSPCQNVNQS